MTDREKLMRSKLKEVFGKDKATEILKPLDKANEIIEGESLGLKFNTHKNFPGEKDTNKECPQPYNLAYENLIPEIKGFNKCLSTVGNLGRRLDVGQVIEILKCHENGRFGIEDRGILAQAIADAFDKGELTEDV